MWIRLILCLVVAVSLSMSTGCMVVERLRAAGALPADNPDQKPNFGRGSDDFPRAGVSNRSREIETSLGVGG